MYSDEELLPLSGLQHLLYCERQWALIHIEQSWVDSADTMRGAFFHECVDAPGYSSARGVRSERRVHVASKKLGLYGVADIVERSDKEGVPAVVPVEYKVGRPKLEDWDRVQVAAQACCLEEMEQVEVREGALFYGETRKREVVPITDDLRNTVQSLSRRMHELFEQGMTPPASFGPKCRRCSLADECLPSTDGLDAKKYWDDRESALRGGQIK